MATFEPEFPLGFPGMARSKLGDDLPTHVMDVRVRDQHRGRSGGISFRLALNSQFRVDLFNDPSDRDRQHRVIGKISKRDLSRRIGWYPLIEIGDHGAWLKYTTVVDFRQSAKSGAGGLLGLKSSEDLEHFYYHRQRRNRLLLNAVSADLADQKSVFSLRDILGLADTQAVGLAAAGRVRLSLEIDWSDLLAAGTTRLAGLLATPDALQIKVPGKASAEFEVDIKDDFKLVFLGRRDGRVRVALRKSRSNQRAVTLGAGLEVRFARPSAVKKILGDVVASLLRISPESFSSAVASLQKKVTLEELSPPEKDLVESLVEHLGLEDEIQRVTDILDVLDDFQAKVNSVISDAARIKAGMNIEFEYSRLQADASIYEGVLTRAAMRRNFRELLAGNFRVLLADAVNHPEEIETLRFLNEKSLVIRQSVGFSLGAGKWSVSGKESTVFRFLTQENREKAVRHLLLGSRKYQGKYFGPYESIALEFKADMREFAPDPALIEASDFRLGLALSYEDGKAWSSRARLRSFVDMGLLWGVVPEGDQEAVVERIRQTFGQRKTRNRITMKLGHEDLLDFCSWLSGAADGHLAAVFAGAMEYQDKRPALQFPQGRTFLYSPFWQQALRRQWSKPSSASAFAVKTFRSLDTSLYHSERQALRGRKRDSATVYMLFQRNPGLLEDFRTLRDTCARLHRLFAQGGAFEELKDIARDIHAFSNVRFKARVLGALIRFWAAQRGEKAGEINSAIVIKSDNGGQSLTIGR